MFSVELLEIFYLKQNFRYGRRWFHWNNGYRTSFEAFDTKRAKYGGNTICVGKGTYHLLLKVTTISIP